MKKGLLAKTIIFATLGILILIFNHPAMEFLNFVVGGAILLYAIYAIGNSIFNKDMIHNDHGLIEGLILLIFATLIMFVVDGDLVKICLIWATWSILREAKEITEDLHRICHKGPGFLSIIESLVVIFMSITMIMNPTEHHAHVHVILLGIELILEVTFPYLYMLWYKVMKKEPVEDD